jgi:hypothetical protein
MYAANIHSRTVQQNFHARPQQFRKIENAVQHPYSNYSNAVRVERGISLEKAMQIAQNDPEIDYFVYIKGGTTVLELPDDFAYDARKDPFHLISHDRWGYMRIFKHGDVVFFKNDGRRLENAPGLADVYEKV